MTTDSLARGATSSQGLPGAAPLSLGAAIESLGVEERAWRFIEGRAGVGERRTLEELGDQEGLTRERVRQLYKKAVKRIGQKVSVLAPALDVLEAQDRPLWRYSEEASLDGPILRAQAALEAGGWQRPRAVSVRRLLLALRALSDMEDDVAETRWPMVAFTVCSLPPIVRGHGGVAKAAEERAQEERERTRTWTYEELAEAVLAQANRPLHWREIADRAEKLGRRPNFNPSALFNAVQGGDDVFARVGPGTYGLVAWGLTDVQFYPDVITEIFEREGKPLAFGETLRRVEAIRAIKVDTLQMYLDLDPRFYRSREGTYGLRSWLPSREKQTLRTPKWQVENADSFERVARAEARGVDVAALVARDRE